MGGEQDSAACPDHYSVEFFAGLNGFEPITHAQSYLAAVSLGENTIQKRIYSAH